jgi:uncharacterized protein YebE (UPF0316 family)
MVLPDSEIFRLAVLPALVFLARIVDVSIGTMRIIYVSRGLKVVASVCGFFEVLIWLLAITQIMQALNNVIMYVTYAGGFAAGNYVGIVIEGKLAVGMVAMRVITTEDATELIERLRESRYGVTTMAARGISGKVRLIFTIVKRKDMRVIADTVRTFNPKAFISIEDVRMVSEGTFPVSGDRPRRDFAGIRSVRKPK